MKQAAIPAVTHHEQTAVRNFLISATEWCERLRATPREFVVIDVVLIILFFLM